MIAIVAAMKEEISDFLALRRYREAGRDGGVRWFESPSARHVAVLIGGVGREGTEAATETALKRYGPDLVVSAGFAGGVRPGLRPGNLVLCDKVWSVEGLPETWSRQKARVMHLLGEASSFGLLQHLEGLRTDVDRAGCLTAPQVVSDIETKKWIGAQFPVAVVDMEGFWVGQAASRNSVAAIAIKAVVDPVEQTLPHFVAGMAAGQTGPRWANAIKYVLTGPHRLPGLFGLASQARAARESLAGYLDALASGALQPRAGTEADGKISHV